MDSPTINQSIDERTITYGNKTIRKTDDPSPVISVLDLIDASTSDGINAPHCFRNIKRKHPHIDALIKSYKFPGKGQQDTPTICINDALQILRVLPKNHRVRCLIDYFQNITTTVHVDADNSLTISSDNPKNILDALVAEHGGQIIAEMRASDGFVNATKMCKMGGKLWAHYLENDTTQVFLQTLSANIGIPIIKLLEIKKGRYGGTWIHHRVAIHLAYWISPQFAVAVTDLVERYVTGRVTTQESKETAILTSNVIEVVSDNVIQSVGYNKQVLGNQIYFGIPGNKLKLDNNATQQGICVKFGITEEGNEMNRFKKHVAEYGGFTLLDCIPCSNPRKIERLLKHSLFIKKRLVCGKAKGKQYRDTELLILKGQDDYKDLFEDTLDLEKRNMNDNEVNETTKQKEIELQIELTKLRNRELEIELELIKLKQRPSIQVNEEVNEDVLVEIEEEVVPRIDDVKIPQLFKPDKTDVRVTYDLWVQPQIHDFSFRDLYTNKKVKWTKNFSSEKQRAVKSQYYKMRPFFEYIDSLPNDDARDIVLNKLNAIMQKLNVDGINFIKVYFYYMKNVPNENAKCNHCYDLKTCRELFAENELFVSV